MTLWSLVFDLALIAGVLGGRAYVRRSRDLHIGSAQDFERYHAEVRPVRARLLVIAIVLCILFTLMMAAAIVDGVLPLDMWLLVVLPAVVAVGLLRGLVLRGMNARRRKVDT